MRLKSYQAATMREALALIRQELGDDAIILSSTRGDGGRGVKVTVAVETPDAQEIAPNDSRVGNAAAELNRSEILDVLSQVLTRHGVPEELNDRLLRSAASLPIRMPLQGLAAALDANFGFNPFPLKQVMKPLFFVGPPGVGKTATLAKLAARTVLSGMEPVIATADTMRAAAVAQLQTYTNALQLPLTVIESPSDLRRLLAAAKPHQIVLVDSGGINPWLGEEIVQLQQLLDQEMPIEPVLVLAAGGDALEMAEAAAHFRTHLPISRLLVTKLDLARRLGGLLTAAFNGRLYLADVAMSPQVADGLNALSPLTLARRLLASYQDPRAPYHPPANAPEPLVGAKVYS